MEGGFGLVARGGGGGRGEDQLLAVSFRQAGRHWRPWVSARGVEGGLG